MKRSTLIGLYIDAVPRILTMIQYQSLVQKRREVYGYIERYKQLPVGSILSKDTYEDDIGQHYAAKLAAAASAESIEEFIAGEINIFRLRLKQTTDSDVYKLFISEYLPRLQNPFTYEVQEDKIFVRIDEKNKINWIGEKKNAELASEVMGAYIKHKSSLAIYAHFTKYYTAQEKFAGGFARSGIEGIGSVLTRGFMDLLKNSTQTLYMSGVPRQYIVAQPVVSVASMKLQEKAIPLCISSVLEKLKTKKHLKYDDRSNLNNFLKAAGVPIEDAISL
ncbi:hypothetical protein NEMIN01_2292, partial [Nematocida minor]|uniref:uncharacterized protein n=1 Tax=Nematocida minor TaxID=1912983 RepID=UPI00222055F4